MTNGTEGLLLQLFTIFVWAKVFGELFERLYLPAVLGEILAGIVLGPYATQFVIPTPTDLFHCRDRRGLPALYRGP